MDMRSLKWLRQTVKEMHLKENTFFDLDHGIKVTLNIAQQILYHVSNSPAKFKVAMSCVIGRKYIISPLTLTSWSRSHEMLPSTFLHYVTYAAAKFEAATSNGLGEYAVT